MTAPGAVVPAAVAWALTYLLHSTLLLGLTALVTHRLVRSDVWREILWRGALFGSVLTATVATSLPSSPSPWRLELTGVEPRTSAVAAGAVETTPSPTGGQASESSRSAAPGPDGSPEAVPEVRGPAGVEPGWSGPALVAWAAGAAAMLALLLSRNVTLFRRLRERKRLADGPLAAMLEELRRHTGHWRPVRLSVSRACSTPLVLGPSEICVPPRFLQGLDEGAQRAALAHELAHIRRRDPQWQLFTGALSALLFFQPLNHLAYRRLREASEHLCDDWTVRHTGSPLHLGRCLTEIASWTSPGPPLRLEGTPAMAEGGSPLLHRIRRIAAGVPAAPELRLWPKLVGGVLLVATATAAPVVAGSQATGALPADPIASVAARDTLETIGLLEELAMEDPSPIVREEAAAELSAFDHPEAAASLMRLLRSASDPEVRATAAAQLDEFPADDVVAILLTAALEDSVADVRENALYTLEDFPMPSAGAALQRVAREHPLPEMRSAALHALTDRGR